MARLCSRTLRQSCDARGRTKGHGIPSRIASTGRSILHDFICRAHPQQWYQCLATFPGARARETRQPSTGGGRIAEARTRLERQDRFTGGLGFLAIRDSPARRGPQRVFYHAAALAEPIRPLAAAHDQLPRALALKRLLYPLKSAAGPLAASAQLPFTPPRVKAD